MNYSVMGDSISTFKGFIPEDYFCYYGDASAYYNLPNGVKDTWWYIVGQKLNLNLCANASYSGGVVTGSSIKSACNDERIANLSNVKSDPDIILIYLGYNDYSIGVPLYSDYHNDLSKEDVFYDSYILMVKKIKERYPNARIICGKLLKGYDDFSNIRNEYKNESGIYLEEYSEVIKKVCIEENVLFADFDLEKYLYDTSEAAHPTHRGHATIAKAWIDYLENILN